MVGLEQYALAIYPDDKIWETVIRVHGDCETGKIKWKISSAAYAVKQAGKDPGRFTPLEGGQKVQSLNFVTYYK